MENNETSPAQLPVAQQTQVQAPPGQPAQPIMYQMAPGQPQPMFVQVPAGQPTTTPEGQPIQYYYAPTAQQAQPGKPVQPVYPVQPGQPVQTYPAPGQPMYAVQPQQHAGPGLEISIDSNFLKSPLCFIKIAEFVTLLIAWASLVRYLEAFSGSVIKDEKAEFFKGITIFCWVMVILFMVMYAFSLPKMCTCSNRPSICTLTMVIIYFVLSALLLACSANLVPRAVDFGEVFKLLGDEAQGYIIALYIAVAFGFISWILFLVDMRLTYRKFQEQRAQELPPGQGPAQKRAWDIDTDFIGSPAFNVKIAEIVTLFVAWVCILKFFDLDIFKTQGGKAKESKADFFRGITIFSWVMVVLLLLTFVFSLNRLCGRRSHWTLTTIITYVVLSILLIACTGNLVPRAIDFGKIIDVLGDKYRPNIIAFFIALGFGFISWILFFVDMFLVCKLFQLQRTQEPQAVPAQQPGAQQPGVVQPGVVQPGVVIVPQGPGQQSVQQPVMYPGYQPVTYPGQQPVQQGVPHPGYQPAVVGVPPPYYNQKL